MPVKVVVKGKKEPEKPGPLPASAQPVVPPKKKRDFFILSRIKKMINIMKLDVRMRFNKKLKDEYGDYVRFAELARKKL